MHNRSLLLHGAKRNKMLTLDEVQRYGSDSFSDPDYIRLYGMTPPQWYARGVRVLGRTAVECTRDPLADRIGRDIAAAAASMPADGRFVVLDPFAGSFVALHQLFSRYPVLKIHQTIPRQTSRNSAVMARLTPTLTSAISKKAQRKPLMR